MLKAMKQKNKFEALKEANEKAKKITSSKTGRTEFTFTRVDWVNVRREARKILNQ